MNDTPSTAPAPAGFLKQIFWNDTEGRLRAGWRILLHLVILAVLVRISGAALQWLVDYLVDSVFKGSRFANLVGMMIQSNFIWVCIIASLALAARFIDRRPFKDFGFAFRRRWWLDFGFGMALGALLMVAIFAAEVALGWVTVTGTYQTNSSTFAAGILLYISLFIGVGIQEETLTRGYWLKNLAEGFNFLRLGTGAALLASYLLTSSIFGLLHLANPNASLVSTLNLMLAGLFLGLATVLTGDLAIPIGLHITWNFFQGNVFGFPVSGSESGTTFIAIQQAGPDLWTGGAFGPEAGLIGIAAILVGAGAILLWIRLTRGKVGWHSPLAVYAGSGQRGGSWPTRPSIDSRIRSA